METRENLDAARPELLGYGFIGGDHAFLDHLVGLVVRPADKPCHLAFTVERHLDLRDFKVERTRGEPSAAELTGQRVDGADRAIHRDRLGAAPHRGDAAAGDDRHNLLVGKAGLRADHRLGE